MGPYALIAITTTESKTVLWPETTQGDFKTLFVVSHKETPYQLTNSKRNAMQCLMTWRLETGPRECRSNENANAAEMKGIDIDDEEEMKGSNWILLGRTRGLTRLLSVLSLAKNPMLSTTTNPAGGGFRGRYSKGRGRIPSYEL